MNKKVLLLLWIILNTYNFHFPMNDEQNQQKPFFLNSLLKLAKTKGENIKKKVVDFSKTALNLGKKSSEKTKEATNNFKNSLNRNYQKLPFLRKRTDEEYN